MHSIYFFIYLCIEHLLVMDGIVKIVLALKLKFLLIILSIGTSYLVEYSLKKQADPFSAIETITPDSVLCGAGNINARSLFKVVDDKNDSGMESSDHFHGRPVPYHTDRPSNYQGLEIYIEL